MSPSGFPLAVPAGQLLVKLQNHADSLPFRDPVDWKAWGKCVLAAGGTGSAAMRARAVRLDVPLAGRRLAVWLACAVLQYLLTGGAGRAAQHGAQLADALTLPRPHRPH